MDRNSSEPIPASARSNTGQQGKWGSACAVCSAAKAKCLRSDDTRGAPCDRCKRLAKECTSQVHYPRKKRTSKASRTSQLEERLDGLVDLLRASGELPTHETRRSQSSALGLGGEHASSQEPSPSASSGIGSTIHVPQNWNRHAPPRCICRSGVGDVVSKRRSDFELLGIYQSRLMTVFPFVLIPPGTQPSSLKAERPFLFSAICMAASILDVRSMRGQMFSLIQRLTSEMLIESNRSMDILQGLLVMLAWYHNHCVMHTQLNNLLHLAQALLADLGLNQHPEVQERSSIMVLNPPQPHRDTNEERRAVLGVWFLSSSVAVGLQKESPMKFTKYFKQCLENLETNPEYQLDALLVRLVRVQRLTEQIHHWISREGEDEDIPVFPRAPVSAYQSMFHGEINQLQASLPTHLRDDKVLQLYFKFAMLHLHQPPLTDATVLKKLADSLTDINSGASSSLDLFYRAQSALQAFYESFFDIPTNIYPGMPVTIMIPIIHSITMLARWAKILGPGHSPRRRNAPPDILTPQKVVWDPSAIRPVPSSMFGAGLAPVPSFTTGGGSTSGMGAEVRPESDAGSDQAPSRLSALSPPITDPSQIPASQFREAADPSIPSSVASLKAKLSTQPGLNLDIIGILSTMAQRCEQVHKELTAEGGGGAWHNDIWFVFSKKVLVARAKLEKWAEIIAKGGVPAPTPAAPMNAAAQQADQADKRGTTQMSSSEATSAGVQASRNQSLYQDGDARAEFQRAIETAGQAILPPDSMDDAWNYGNMWSDDMFDQLDPSLWLTDSSDWSMALLAPVQESQLEL